MLAKYGQATYDYAFGADVDQTRLELNLNYIIKTFNARISLYYIDMSSIRLSAATRTTIGLGLQVQI